MGIKVQSFVLMMFVFVMVLLLGMGAPHAKDSDAGAKVSPPERTANRMIDDIKKRGKLIVAQVGVDQPPFFWRDEKGGLDTWRGYEIDLAEEIARRLGVELEILRLGDVYNEVCQAVNQGLADIGISNLSDTSARRELVDFTQPYIVSRVSMLVDIEGLERDGLEVIEPKDLNDPRVKVALTPGSSYDFVVDELMPKAQRIETQQGDFDVISKPVIEGKAHVIPDDGLVLHLGMMQNPQYASRMYLHVFDEYDDPLSICLPHNQEALREFINGIIQEIEDVEPVTLEYLVEKYMQ